MTRVGFDLDPKGEDPGVSGKFALAEELGGVRVTADLLSRCPVPPTSPGMWATAPARPLL